MRRVLVVEDDHLVYDAIRDAFLIKGGFEVAHAGDGESALATLDREKPDLALIDFWLPKASGITIAQQAAARNVVAILMSGYPDVIARRDLYEFPVLPKPFRISAFIDGLDDVIAEASRLRRIMHEQVEASVACRNETRTQPPRLLSDQWLRICDRLALRDFSARA